MVELGSHFLSAESNLVLIMNVTQPRMAHRRVQASHSQSFHRIRIFILSGGESFSIAKRFPGHITQPPDLLYGQYEQKTQLLRESPGSHHHNLLFPTTNIKLPKTLCRRHPLNKPIRSTGISQTTIAESKFIIIHKMINAIISPRITSAFRHFQTHKQVHTNTQPFRPLLVQSTCSQLHQPFMKNHSSEQWALSGSRKRCGSDSGISLHLKPRGETTIYTSVPNFVR